MEQARNDREIVEVGELRRHARTAWTRGIGVLRVSSTGGAAGYLVWQAISILEHAERGATSVRPDRGLMRGQGAAAGELLWALWTAAVGTTRDGLSVDHARRLALISQVDETLRGIIASLGDEWDDGLSKKYELLVTKRRDRIARAIAQVDIDSIAAALPPARHHAGTSCVIACEAHRWSVACSLAAAPSPADLAEAAIHAAIAREARLARARVLYMVRVELEARSYGAAPWLRTRYAALVTRARMLDACEHVIDAEVAQLVDEVLALEPLVATAAESR